MTTPATDKTTLLELLRPITTAVAELRVDEQDDPSLLEAELNRRFPRDGELATAVGQSLAAGVASGWLCDRGDETARFSRLAKPSPETLDLSIDVVSLDGAGVRHTHPRGEVTLGFVTGDGANATFDGRPPGWVFCAPSSTHVPTTTGGRMHLIYWIPGGEVVWDRS